MKNWNKLLCFFSLMFSLSLISCSVDEENLGGGITPESITFDGSVKTLNVGDMLQLEVVLEPVNADTTSLVWDSSDWIVASVDRFGRVTGLEEGTAEISVSAGEVKASISINVVGVAVEDLVVDIEGELLKITEGETRHIYATVSPENATDKKIIWKSADPAIVSVDEDGNLTAVKEGETTLTVKAGGLEKTYTVRVYSGEFKLSEEEPFKLKSGETITLKVTKTLESENNDIVWSTSDDKVAIVQQSEDNPYEAVVRGVGFGMAYIRVSSGLLSAECIVISSANPVEIDETTATATINLDLLADGEIRTIITELDTRETPIENYKLKGNFGKLGIISGDKASNPFRNTTNARIIDFEQISPDTWPIVTIKSVEKENKENIEYKGKGLPESAFNAGSSDEKPNCYKGLVEVKLPEIVEVVGKFCFQRTNAQILKLPGVKYLGDTFLNASSVIDLRLTTSQEFVLSTDKNGKENAFDGFKSKDAVLTLDKAKENNGENGFGLTWKQIKYK